MSFSNPFHRLSAANLAAQSAEQIGLAAMPMLAVLSLGAGAAETGFLSAMQSLPFFLLSLPAGVLADRAGRRRLMMLAELLRAAALLILPLLLWNGVLTLTTLAAIGALTATGTVVFSVAAPALVPSLVPRPLLAAANTRLELARSVAFTAGPALAGVLLAGAGAPAAFLLAAAFSLAAALLLAGLPEPSSIPAPGRRIVADLVEALRFIRHQPLLRPIIATSVVWNLSWFILQSVYVLYATTQLHLDAAGIGLSLGGYGFGMLVGALAAPRISHHLTVGVFIALGPVASVGAAGLLLSGASIPGLALPLLGFFLFGFGPILWTIGQTTLRQAVTPPVMLGRVSAVVMTASYGARPLGAALGALVATSAGLRWAVAVAALGFVLQAAIILFSAIPALRVLPEPAYSA